MHFKPISDLHAEESYCLQVAKKQICLLVPIANVRESLGLLGRPTFVTHRALPAPPSLLESANFFQTELRCLEVQMRLQSERIKSGSWDKGFKT
jgi:hypothetical protein